MSGPSHNPASANALFKRNALAAPATPREPHKAAPPLAAEREDEEEIVEDEPVSRSSAPASEPEAETEKPDGVEIQHTRRHKVHQPEVPVDEKHQERMAREEQASSQLPNQNAGDGQGRGRKYRPPEHKQAPEEAEAPGETTSTPRATILRGNQEWLLTGPGGRAQHREMREEDVSSFSRPKDVLGGASTDTGGGDQELGWDGQGKGGGGRERRPPPPQQAESEAASDLDRLTESAPLGLPKWSLPPVAGLALAPPVEPPAAPLLPVVEEPDWPADVRQALETMLPEGLCQRRLGHVLAPFGSGILRLCQQFGITAVVQAGPTAYHLDERRLDVCQTELSFPRPILQAFAEAYDHALGSGRYASLTSMAVLASCPQVQSPQQFFAESLAAHVQGEATRDSPLFSYVDYLLQQSRALKFA